MWKVDYSKERDARSSTARVLSLNKRLLCKALSEVSILRSRDLELLSSGQARNLGDRIVLYS